MYGCRSRASVRASRRNRSRNAGSARRSGRMTLMATGRSSSVWRHCTQGQEVDQRRHEPRTPHGEHPDGWKAALAAWPLFVTGGAVQAGNRDVVEAEIDAQDGAVVDDVVEDEASDDRRPGHRE